MTRRVLLALVPLVVSALAVGNGGTALGQAARQAQEPTPIADGVACTVAPRTVAEIEAVVAAATPESLAPAPFEPPGGEPIADGSPVPVGFALPPGEPIAAETAQAVAEVAAQYVACANADDVLALAALVSDRFLQRSFAAPPGPGGAADVFVATPRPRPAVAQTTLLAVRDGRRLTDGRIGVLLDLLDPTDERARGGPSTDFVTLVEEEGRLVIDEYRSRVAAPPAATPTA